MSSPFSNPHAIGHNSQSRKLDKLFISSLGKAQDTNAGGGRHGNIRYVPLHSTTIAVGLKAVAVRTTIIAGYALASDTSLPSWQRPARSPTRLVYGGRAPEALFGDRASSDLMLVVADDLAVTRAIPVHKEVLRQRNANGYFAKLLANPQAHAEYSHQPGGPPLVRR